MEFKPSLEEGDTDVLETARELGLEEKLEDRTELRQSHNQCGADEAHASHHEASDVVS